MFRRGLVLALWLWAFVLPAFGQVSVELFKNLRWRNIGPANMGGRITDVEGIPGNPRTVYVATATSGLWKTTTMGIRWEPLFDDQETQTIGDIALDPQNPEVIWVGTGEANLRNSISIGCGVYRSNDGGKTWQYLGLRETRQISRIVVHPRDPNTVWVAAIGSPFGPNPERGVFMTTDGGKTWQKVLYIDEHHGASDLDIDPVNPNILYAGMWRFERKPWTHTSGSEQGGLFKSTDGGKTWRRITNGLPRLMGRVGVKVAPSNPNVVYLIAESNDGTLFRSNDKGETFQLVSRETNIVSRGFYYTDMRVDPQDENRLYFLATQLRLSIDGGRTSQQIASSVHVDHHALWIDPTNPNILWNGNDGGLAFSLDRGATWDVVSNLPLAQFYQIHLSNEAPFYQVAGGLQDNGSWIGYARTKEGGIVNEHWRMVSFGDGFYCLIHSQNPNLIISESQGGNVLRTNLATGIQENISPQARRGDGGPVKDLKYRFNWNTPIIPSPHDPNTVYVGGNVVFKSTDFGTTWTVISPDLTTNDPSKQGDAGGPVWVENTTAEFHCTIISLAESPLQPGVIWVGTDDGNLQVTFDGGLRWTNLTPNVPNLPPNSPVSHVEPSRANIQTAYVSFDRHMLNDFKPYLYKTTDGGTTWQPLTNGLPDEAYIFVVREDPRNLNLLYAGTERGLFISFDGGQNWQKMPNLPAVPVHDIQFHPVMNDLVLGTHGRSVYVLDDITPLQQVSAEVLEKPAHLFEPPTAWRFSSRMTRYGRGDRPMVAPNPPTGAMITYSLKERPKEGRVRLQILDSQGKVLRELTRIPQEPGIHRVEWDLRIRVDGGSDDEEGTPQQGATLAGGAPPSPLGPQALPGTYRVRLIAGDFQMEQPLTVRVEPALEPHLANMKAGYQFALETLEMIRQLNRAMRTLNGVEEQLNNLRQVARNQNIRLSQEVNDAITEHLKKISDLKAEVDNPNTGLAYARGPRLRGRLNSVYGAMGSNTGPTLAQVAYFNEVKQEFETVHGAIQAYLRQRVPELNDLLKAQGLPTLLLGEQ
ncbi:MAG: glycosyl hydrolase [Fimbriimonadales bacterium]